MKIITTNNTNNTNGDLLGAFMEELWDAVWRMRVGSGLTDEQVARALEILRRRLMEAVQDE